MHVLILGASPETMFWDDGPKGNFDKILCADGGMELAHKWGLIPNWVIGDKDSYSKTLPRGVNKKISPLFTEKTDGELAIIKAISLGARTITLVGFLGGRLDHTIANLFYVASLRDVCCVFKESWGEVFFAKEFTKIAGAKGDLLSLIPFNGDVEGVVTSGLKYPLQSETLTMHSTRGVSNALSCNRCTIEKQRGDLLIVHLAKGGSI